MKKFWKKTEGFTLVELIVVIAILGILAGVGTVGYSGYIKKANMAADQQLLGYINQAFSAACIENGLDSKDVEAEAIAIGADKKVATADIVVTDPAVEATDIQTSFGKYFAGNEGSEFKVVTDLSYTAGIGFWSAQLGSVDGGVFSQIFETLGDAISGSVTKVKDSTFGTIGAQGLMNKVDTVTNLASNLAAINSTFKGALAQNMMTLSATLGFTAENDPDGSKFTAMYNEIWAKAAAKIDPENPTSDAAMNAAGNQILANYAVLAAAQNTTKTSDELLAELHAGIQVDDIKNLMKGDGNSSQEGLSKAAMMYAMYTAYANQMPETTDDEKAAKNAALQNAATTEGFLAHMEDAEFKAYLNDSEGSAKADLEGYLGALDIIKQSAQGNPDAVSDLLVNGYTDPDLIAALQGLLG